MKGLSAGVVALAVTVIVFGLSSPPENDEPGRLPQPAPVWARSLPSSAADQPATVPEDPPWRDAVLGFAAALTAHDGDQDQWLARLAPWVTPALLVGYEATDPRLLPTGRVESVRALAVGMGDVESIVTLASGEGFSVRVELQVAARWQVTAVAGSDPAT